jgi:hypothetical protein
MTLRKDMSEGALFMDGSSVLLLQQEDFHEFKRAEVEGLLDRDPCHIYMLVRRTQNHGSPWKLTFAS